MYNVVMNIVEGVKAKAKGRSYAWGPFQRLFKQNKVCVCCGTTTKLQVHHKIPYHCFKDWIEGRTPWPVDIETICWDVGILEPNYFKDKTVKQIEMDPRICIVLCMSKTACHLWKGHRGNFKFFNRYVLKDVRTAPVKGI